MTPWPRKSKLCDGRTGVNFRMKPVKNAGSMKEKELFSEFGTTTTTTLKAYEAVLWHWACLPW
eukprot:scaffold499_cov335-Pavlova_lutheri.AAC.13